MAQFSSETKPVRGEHEGRLGLSETSRLGRSETSRMGRSESSQGRRPSPPSESSGRSQAASLGTDEEPATFCTWVVNHVCGRLLRILTAKKDLPEDSRWEKGYTFGVDEHLKTLWEGDPLRALKSLGGVGEKKQDRFDEMFLRWTRELPPDDPVVWFTPGTTMHRYRQRCLSLKDNSIFQNFFLAVILVNAIFLGFEAGLEPLSPGWAFESVCTSLYWIELIISTLGCPKYPWRVISLWFDWFLVIMSTLDLWVFALLDLLGVFPRPRLSAIAVLRLFRLSRVFKAADSFLIYARPLRMVKWTLRYSPAFLLVILLLVAFFMYMATITLKSSARVREEETVTRYSTYQDTVAEVVGLLGGAYRWSENSSFLPQGKAVLAKAVLADVCFHVFSFAVKVTLSGMVIGVGVEQLLRAGQDDDKITDLKTAHREMNVPKLKKILKKMDTDNSGSIYIEEVKLALDNNCGKLNKDFGMSAEQMLQCCRMVDAEEDGMIGYDAVLEVILTNWVREKHVACMLDQFRMNQLVRQAGEINGLVRQLALTTYKDDLGDNDASSPQVRQEATKRQSNNKHQKRKAHRADFKSCLVATGADAVEYVAVSNALIEEMDRCMDHIGERLDHFLDVASGAASNGHTEGGILFASVQFRLDILKCRQLLDKWTRMQG